MMIFINNIIAVSTTVALLLQQQHHHVSAFTFTTHQSITKPSLLLQRHHQHHHQRRHTIPTTSTTSTTSTLLHAGGFEWDDPNEAFDQGVENPFKNPAFKKKDGDDDDGSGSEVMTVDAGRLLAPRLQGCNLYLIGMMGSGKSAVGDIVARRMGTYNFLDTDTIIESATNLTIPQIFSTEGEDTFRDIESQILDSVHAYVRCVVSTGGGIVCRLANWSKLQTGIVIFLDVSPKVIMSRIEGSTDRPLLQTEDPLETLETLLEERKDRYNQADIRIEVEEGDTEQMVADDIIRAVHDYIDEHPPAWKMAKAKAQSEGLDWVQ